jgi:hypothetical protein
MERIVARTHDGKTKAYSFSSLRHVGVIEDEIDAKHYVIFFQDGARTVDASRIADSRAAGAAGVFSPDLGDKILRFHLKEKAIMDEQTGSTWNILGVATGGPLSGQRLKPVEHTVAFAFAWLIFRPDAEIVTPVNASK